MYKMIYCSQVFMNQSQLHYLTILIMKIFLKLDILSMILIQYFSNLGKYVNVVTLQFDPSKPTTMKNRNTVRYIAIYNMYTILFVSNWKSELCTKKVFLYQVIQQNNNHTVITHGKVRISMQYNCTELHIIQNYLLENMINFYCKISII